MGKMSRFLRFLTCLATTIFVGNAFAAGYTCSSLPTYLSCQAGYYMTSSSSSTTYDGTPKTGNYCQPCSKMGSNYTCAGGTAAPQQTEGGYSCPEYKKYTCCAAGYYMTKTATSTDYYGTPVVANACRPCSVYGENYTCPAGSDGCTAAPQAITINVTCPAGQYLPKGKTACEPCTAGNYCEGISVKGVSLVTGAEKDFGIEGCAENTMMWYLENGDGSDNLLDDNLYSNSAIGSSSINQCYVVLRSGAAVYGHGQGLVSCRAGDYCNVSDVKIYFDASEDRGLTDSMPTVGGAASCARGAYSGSDKNACTACQNGQTTSATGAISCNATCSNADNVTEWNTATWQENYVSNHCSIKTCATGYKLENNKCVLSTIHCDAGSYLPAKWTSCNTCEEGRFCEGGDFNYSTNDQGFEYCPNNYPFSDAGATARTECYGAQKDRPWSGEQKSCALPDGCDTVKCTECKRDACKYVAYSNEDGTADGKVKSGCETNNEACQQEPDSASITAAAGNYVTGITCPACSTLGNGEYTLSLKGNNNGAQACYMNCKTACTRPTCPLHAICSYTDTSTDGVQYYGGTCGAAASTCPMTFVCENGYTKTSDGTGCQVANYTITYLIGKTGFDQERRSQSVTYLEKFTTLPANTFSRPGYSFQSWGGSYPQPSTEYTYSTAGDTILMASWTACEAAVTSPGTCNCGSNQYPNGQGCSDCVKSCSTVSIYTKGSYNVCQSQTVADGCYRDCTTSDVPNSAAVTGTVKYDAVSNTCAATKCNTNYYLSDGKCVTCPDNAICGGDDKITCEDGYTLNGKVCEPNKYTVTFDANEGTGGPAAQTVEFGKKMATLTTLPTRATYSFVGYFDTKTGGTQYYASNGTAVRAWDKLSDTTLYAHWSQNQVTCEAGKYYDGTAQVDCPSGKYCPGTGTTIEGGAGCAIECTTLGSEYTASDVGASASGQCFKACDAACSGEDTDSCTFPKKSCVYNQNATVAGKQYYGESTCAATGKTECPISFFKCSNNYYQNEDMCVKCSTLGDGSFSYSNNNNFGGPDVCYKVCSVACTKDPCTEHATCDYEDKYKNGGYYWNNPTVCTAAAISCPITIKCDANYELDANTGTCPGVLYTITLDDNNGTGGDGTAYQQYNTDWFSDAAKTNSINKVTAPTRDGWTFLGYYTTQTGGSMMISDDGTLPSNTAFTENTTLYAHWSQNATTCQAGKYYDGANHVTCPAGKYCDGTGTSAIGTAGCAAACPAGGTSSSGSTDQKDCFVACPAPATIANGRLENAQTQQNYDGSAYPECTYHAVCNTGYIAKDDYTTAPTCIWGDGACPENYYCDPDPVACPDGGLSNAGDSDITQCYKLYDDYDGFQNGTASAICYYQTATNAYDRCQVRTVKTCYAGYWYQNPTMPDEFLCRSVQDKYYSPNPNIYQTECPDKTNQYVHSEENAASYVNCYKQCVLDVPHATTVAAAKNTVYGISTTQYEACSFNVTCDTGYTVRNNNTAAPSCQANAYTITLDKNGGTGSTPASVTCTFDSGACTLPATSGLNRAGYGVEAKWCSTKNGGAPCYEAGKSIAENISGDGTAVTLYAVWTPQVYTVKLDSRNADVVAAPDTVYLKYATGWFNNAAATDPIIALTTLPSKAAWFFTGFYDAIEGGQQIISADGKFGTSEAALTMTTKSPATIYARLEAGTVTCDAGTYYTGTGPDCTICPANNYCEGGTFGADSGNVGGLVACPDGGKSPTSATSAAQCYKENLDTYVSDHGRGTQTCNYDTAASDYTADCRDRNMTSCDAGYWLRDTSNHTDPDCDSVDDGYWSAASTLTQTACHGYTSGGAVHSKPNAVKVQDCYKEGVAYNATKGSGTQTCYYSVGEGDSAVYGNECYDITINKCNKGYWLADSADIDCSVADFNYYSGADEITRTACPAGGKTRIDTAEAPQQCYKDGQPYTADHGVGYRVCFYTSGTGDDARYDSACETPTMTKCTGGYYYDIEKNKMDCIVVGYGYYSTNNIEREQCKPDGTTKTETSTSSADCYMDGMACPVTSGSGTQTCYYDAAADAYTASCTTCTVTSCDEGFSQVGNECVNCPAGSVCSDGTQKTCAELTNGEYPLSDAGTTDVAMCYRNCTLADNAASMSGRDYQGAPDTCAIKRCAAGWHLENGVCVLCPEGSFCGDPDNPDPDAPDVKSCPADWPLSDKGAKSQNDCYRKCEEYAIEGGKAVPVSDKANYPKVCEFKGVSDSGNPCEIVDDKCVETSCNGDFEMINGKCEPCNRDHALTYQKTGNCIVASCEVNYHPNGQSCEYDVQECTAPNAVSAEKRWDAKLQAFGVCTIKECEEGFHISSNACVSDQQQCTVDHGTGIKEWDHVANRWGKCVATYCDAGYTNDPDLVDSRDASKPCGVCRNKFAVDGEIAASSYIRECEIASCMYQGEMYNLEDNECKPICSVVGYSDETGTEKWDATRKKCVRTCNAGYTPW